MNIDLNADIGEGLANDEDLMAFISSANIACGGHAGHWQTMEKTVALCKKHRVAVGAHPSFFDRENFGRVEMGLPEEEIRKLIISQVTVFQKVCNVAGVAINHVKPHGALYNMSARDPALARAIAETVYAISPSLKLFGLSGSHSVEQGKKAGLTTVAEVFADRAYREDGSLMPRNQPGALVTSPQAAVGQALMLATEQRVRAANGQLIPLEAQSICLHGDGPHAVSFARNIYNTLSERGILIQPV